MSKKLTYRSFAESLSLFFALIIAFWIPSYRWLLSYFIVGWLVFLILDLIVNKRLKLNFTNRFTITIFWIQLLFFSLMVSELFIADNNDLILKSLVQKLSLLIFPVLFALSGKKIIEKKDLFLKVFVLSNVLMSLICLFVALYHSLSFFEGDLVFKPNYLSYRSYFTQSDLSIFHHRSYFSMYIVFSIAILFWLNKNNKISKILSALLMVFFTIMIFLLESRAGIISLFLLFSFEIIFKVYQLKNILIRLLTPLIILIMAFFVLRSDRVSRTVDVFLENDKTMFKTVEKDVPTRIVLWSAAVKIIEKDFWTGTGVENFQSNFTEIYQSYENENILISGNKKYNVHNQFLEEFVLYGIFGFLFLLSLFIYPLVVSFKQKKYLFISFLLIAGFNFLFESMFNTIAGVVFFFYFFNYFVFIYNTEKEKPTNTIIS